MGFHNTDIKDRESGTIYRVFPGGKVTLKWGWTVSEGGVHGGLDFFNIDVRVGDTLIGRKTGLKLTGSKNVYEYTLNLSEWTSSLVQYRGKQITFIIGAHYERSYSESDYASGVINTLPIMPSVTPIKTVIPSSGVGFVEIDLPTVDQPAALYWSTSLEDKGTPCYWEFDERVELEPGVNEGTIYIWADNGERSITTVAVPFTRNTQPSVSLEVKDTDAPICTLNVTPTGGQSNNKYTIKQNINGVETVVAKDSGSTQFSITNPRLSLGVLESDSYYSVSYTVERNDGVEKCYVAADDAFATPVVKISGTKGQAHQANSLEYFDESFEVFFGRNSSYNTWDAMHFNPSLYHVGITSEETLSKLISFDTTRDGYYAQFAKDDLEELEQGEQLENLTLISIGNFDKWAEINIGNSAYKVVDPDLTPKSLPDFHFYSDSSFTITLPGMGQEFLACGFEEREGSFAPDIFLHNQNLSSMTTLRCSSSSLIMDDEYTYYIDGKDLYNIIINFEGRERAELKMYTHNKYGREISRIISIPLSFAEPARFTTFPVFKPAVTVTIEEVEYIKNGSIIQCGMGVLAYEPPRAQFGCVGYTKGEWFDGTPNWNVVYGAQSPESVKGYCDKLGMYYNKLPNYYYIAATGLKATQIPTGETRDYVGALYCQILTSSPEVCFYQTEPIQILGQRTPQMHVEVAEYDEENQKIKIKAAIEPGHSGGFTDVENCHLVINNVEYPATQLDNLNNFEVNVDATLKGLIQGSSHLVLYFKGRSNFYIRNGDNKLSKSSRSCEITTPYTMYNAVPTVAYRENQLGINTTNLMSDQVLNISGHSKKQHLGLSGINGSEEHYAYIDLGTGKMVNFVIDCGWWSLLGKLDSPEDCWVEEI